MQDHPVVSREQWLEARRALGRRERELTKLHDKIAEERRALPWVRIDKRYEFDSATGPRTLADLFDGRSQLVVQHFMFGPDWDEGCLGCSFGADHVDAARRHFEHNDLSYVAISRAPLEKLLAYRKRMGWTFEWVSSLRSDFNFDFHVSFTEAEKAKGEVFYNFKAQPYESDELPGVSVFHKDESGSIFHTYSAFGRGDEAVLGAYAWLDMAPKGRNEKGPNFNLTDWVRRHDEYDDATAKAGCCA